MSHQISSDRTYQIAYDVAYDYDGSCKFYIESLLVADDHGHCHGKHREQKFIVHSCYSTREGHDGMHDCKCVDDPGWLYSLEKRHSYIFKVSKITKNAPNVQLLPNFRP